MTRPEAFPVPAEFRRHGCRDEDESMTSALWQIEHMCEHVGREDLAEVELLDFGCGTRFTRALISQSVPIKSYVGFDVYGKMIDFLRKSVRDPRFEYFHINAYNERYNPKGEVLSEGMELPISGRTFDVICLFSVFSHLAPHDYHTMLKLLRRYVKPDGKLFYTLFIDELTEAGNGLMDKWRANVVSRLSPEQIAQAIKKHESSEPHAVEPFKDLEPSSPLRWAVYSEQHARELIAGTGWEFLTLSPPIGFVRQHHIVCAPA
jgi:SAM-dependent methyltransferase